MLDYLTTSIIWAIRFADNAVTELLTAAPIKNIQTSTLTATGSIQASWAGKAASPAWKRSWRGYTPALAWTSGFRKERLEANILLGHWFMKTTDVWCQVSWVLGAGLRLLLKTYCWYAFSKSFFNWSHDYTAVCPSEVTKFTKKEALFCPLSEFTGFPLLVI